MPDCSSIGALSAPPGPSKGRGNAPSSTIKRSDGTSLPPSYAQPGHWLCAQLALNQLELKQELKHDPLARLKIKMAAEKKQKLRELLPDSPAKAQKRIRHVRRARRFVSAIEDGRPLAKVVSGVRAWIQRADDEGAQATLSQAFLDLAKAVACRCDATHLKLGKQLRELAALSPSDDRHNNLFRNACVAVTEANALRKLIATLYEAIQPLDESRPAAFLKGAACLSDMKTLHQQTHERFQQFERTNFRGGIAARSGSMPEAPGRPGVTAKDLRKSVEALRQALEAGASGDTLASSVGAWIDAVQDGNHIRKKWIQKALDPICQALANRCQAAHELADHCWQDIAPGSPRIDTGILERARATAHDCKTLAKAVEAVLDRAPVGKLDNFPEFDSNYVHRLHADRLLRRCDEFSGKQLSAHKKTPGRPKVSCPPRGAGWAQPGPGGPQKQGTPAASADPVKAVAGQDNPPAMKPGRFSRLISKLFNNR